MSTDDQSATWLRLACVISIAERWSLIPIIVTSFDSHRNRTVHQRLHAQGECRIHGNVGKYRLHALTWWRESWLHGIISRLSDCAICLGVFQKGDRLLYIKYKLHNLQAYRMTGDILILQLNILKNTRNGGNCP